MCVCLAHLSHDSRQQRGLPGADRAGHAHQPAAPQLQRDVTQRHQQLSGRLGVQLGLGAGRGRRLHPAVTAGGLRRRLGVSRGGFLGRDLLQFAF